MKKLKIAGLIILMIASMIYDYVSPEKVTKPPKKALTVTLSGAFKKTGAVKIKEGMKTEELVRQVGVLKNANLKALPLQETVHAEQSIYLPQKHKMMISLNHAKAQDFMTLSGVGEKTAAKIIDYRKKQRFVWIEDIMNVSGIGEKRFENYREYLCL